MKSKKGLSPVVTTILLILLVIILAGLVFAWWKLLLVEQFEKFDESTGENRPIDEVCDKVVLDISLVGSQLTILNAGPIPVDKVNLVVDGSIVEEIELALSPGGIKTISLSNSYSGEKKIAPILIATSKKTNENKLYPCPKENWQTL